MRNTITVGSGFGRVIGILLVAVMFATSAFAETATENYWERMGAAEKQLDKAYTDLGKVDKDLTKNKPIDAKNAFNSAIKHLDKAIVDYAEAAATPDQKDAVKNLKSGLAQMRDCVKSLEINDIDTAQGHCDKGWGLIDKAAAVLRAPG